jgi:hypothetical protein
MEPILRLNYDLDLKQISTAINAARSIANPYVDHRVPNGISFWKIAHYTNDYLENIKTDFGVNGKIRFYFAAANSVVPTHVDNGTQCAINFILSEDAAPVTYDGVDYLYKQALLNTSIPHGVVNGPVERILLKISIFDESYESLAARIKYKL